MFRLCYFAILAIALGLLATFLASNELLHPIFKYGVAFIGYSVASALIVAGLITRNDD